MSLRNNIEALSRPEFSTALQGIRRGIEKESLRVTYDSHLAATVHPVSLGAPLTHSLITTDYAETMMEFITPVRTDAEEIIGIMADIHRHVYRHLGDELLWPISMPCTIETEDDIKIARYGTSNAGKMKTIYRQGLQNRYGSLMQTIAGVHYNFSLPDHFWPVWQQIKNDQQPLQDFISESYLDLTRNFLRLGWLIPFLFGASPVVDSTFLKNTCKTLPLKTMGHSSHYLPNATSLRMSQMGYKNKEQDNLPISYNNLSDFVSGLRLATRQSNPVFEKIGVKLDGRYRQLNTNTLQEEGELYAPIRPKRVTKSGEKLSNALEARGIEYIEIRSLDVNPYTETGIDLDQIYFLDVFLTYCLLKKSPSLSLEQKQTTQQNIHKVTTCGRNLTLELLDGNIPKSLGDWGEEIFSDLIEVARLLDKNVKTDRFETALTRQHNLLRDPSQTPSARMLQDMTGQGLEVNELAMKLAKKYRQNLLKTDYTHVDTSTFTSEKITSEQQQRAIEEADRVSFDDFLQITSGNFV